MDQLTQSAISSAIDAYAISYAMNFAEAGFLADSLGTTYQGLQLYPETASESIKRWTFPGVVGNTDPTKKVTHGTHGWTPGDPAIFNCNPSQFNEDNYYCYMKLPMPAALPSQIVDERQFLIANPANFQALEWQWQITMGGQIWNGAWQLSSGSGVRTFDYTAGKWVTTGLPIPDMGKVITAQCAYKLDAKSCQHVGIKLNGTLFALNISRAPTPTKSADKFTIAFQVDPKKGQPCSLQILDTELRYV